MSLLDCPNGFERFRLAASSSCESISIIIISCYALSLSLSYTWAPWRKSTLLLLLARRRHFQWIEGVYVPCVQKISCSPSSIPFRVTLCLCTDLSSDGATFLSFSLQLAAPRLVRVFAQITRQQILTDCKVRTTDSRFGRRRQKTWRGGGEDKTVSKAKFGQHEQRDLFPPSRGVYPWVSSNVSSQKKITNYATMSTLTIDQMWLMFYGNSAHGEHFGWNIEYHLHIYMFLAGISIYLLWLANNIPRRRIISTYAFISPWQGIFNKLIWGLNLLMKN